MTSSNPSISVDQSPLVSVCIPVYNGSRYIAETVESVLRQTWQNWELIVVDNASTDDTAPILERLMAASSDPRIKVHRNPCTVAAPENWNVAVRAAQGEFIKLLCADDVLYPGCLESQVKIFDAHPRVTVVAGARTVINAAGNRLFTRCGIAKEGVYVGRDMVRRCLLSGTNIIGDPVVVMCRRSSIEEVGLFDPTVVYCTDLEMWLRLLGVGDLYFSTDPVGYYRIHGGAAARGFRNVVVRDFLHTASLQEKRGTVKFTQFERKQMAVKSYAQGLIRQWLYRFLGGEKS